MNHASVNSSAGPAGFSGDAVGSSDAGARRADGAGHASSTTANLAAWMLVLAFVGLVLSVVAPAMGDGARADWAAALLFMVGLAATLLGSGLAVSAATAKARALFGALVMLVGLVLMYGIVPSIAALGVVLVGAAVQIGSLPAGD